ncbi:MAG: exosortase/archaeosortase family protein [Candidatus Micrarchaeia archaeon]
MKYNKNLAFVLFAIFIALSILYNITLTNSRISDTNPSTYVIIPILMLPIFGFFYIKKNIKINVKKIDIISSIVLFLLLIIITFYMRVYLSYLFLAYRIDLILLPLLLVVFVTLLFGIKNIKKFYILYLYSIFTSPFVLSFLINLNSLFTILNTKLVYYILSISIKGIVYSAPITIIANGYRIGIGESCVGLGLLIAIIFLLLPVAFFFNGKNKKKIFWIVFGVFTLLLINIIRMTFIALEWILNGPTSGLLLFHEFAGIFLFYLSIIIVLLLAGKFGLSVPHLKNQFIKNKKSIYFGITLSFIFAISYLFLYLNYNVVYARSYQNALNNLNSTLQLKQLVSYINISNYPVGVVKNGNNSYALEVYHNESEINTTSPIIFSYFNSSFVYKNSPTFVINKNGITSTFYYNISNSTSFVVFEEGLPYNISTLEFGVEYLYAIIPTSSLKYYSCSYKENLQDIIYNSLSFHFYNSTVTKDLNKGACIIDNLVKI